MMMLAISRNTAIASISGSGITIKWTYIIIGITFVFSIGTSIPYLYYHEVIDIAERYPQNFTDNFQLCLNMSLGHTKQALIIFIFIIQETWSSIWRPCRPSVYAESTFLYPKIFLHQKIFYAK